MSFDTFVPFLVSITNKIAVLMHNFSKKISFLFWVFLLFQTPKSADAQAQLGLRLENYAGINGISLNPTAGIYNPLGWDVSIGAAGSFLDNNYAFIRNTNIVSLLKNVQNISFAPEANIDYPQKTAYVMDFPNRNRVKYLSTAHFVTLPSVQLNFANGNSFGLFWGQQVAVVSRNIPTIADPYAQQKIAINQRVPIPPFNVTGATWGEVGINWAHHFGSNTEGGLSVGATLKWIRPNQVFFVDNREGTAITRLRKDSSRIDAVNLGVGFITNYADENLPSNGSGVGLDVGASFVLPTYDEWDNRPYRVRMSAAILDIGRFTVSNSAQIHEVKFTEPLNLKADDFQNLDPNDPATDAVRRFNQSVFGRNDATLRGNSFALSLPTSMVLQADFAVLPSFFINGLLVQRVPSVNRSLSKDNILAVTPRYESRWLSASLPVSLLNYEQVRIGLAARLAFLVIGTDNLGSFLGQKRLTGSDFYLALKINAFKIGQLKGGTNLFNGGNGKAAKCFRF
jgi:Family of unknown function (DUF5723)